MSARRFPQGVCVSLQIPRADAAVPGENGSKLDVTAAARLGQRPACAMSTNPSPEDKSCNESRQASAEAAVLTGWE
jgi:hypothetical protein